MMEVEAWIVVNADEESEVYAMESDAKEHGLTGAVRIVRVTVKVPVPKVVEVAVTVPDEPQAVTVKVA